MEATYGTVTSTSNGVSDTTNGTTNKVAAVPTISRFVEEFVNRPQAPKASLAAKHGRTFAAVVSAALGSMTLGCMIGYTSPGIPSMESTMAFNLTAGEVAWVASIISIGGILGQLFGGLCIDRFGRKMTLVLVSVPFIVGWMLIGFARNVTVVYVGRFLTGFGSGIIDVSVPVYIAEISEKSVRGFMGSCHELFVNLGYLFVFALGIFLPWNWLAIGSAFVPAVMLVAMSYMPESPRWLLGRGRRDECLDVLVWLRGSDVDVVPELTAIDENVRESGSTMEWRELGRPVILKPLGIIVALLFCQQFSGYGAIPEFLVTIFRSAGVVWNPYTLTAIVGVAGVVANLVSALVVDRVGRRVMLMLSAALMLLGVGALGAFFTAIAGAGLNAEALQWIPTLALITYNFGVALGYGPIPFYMASELFPLRARGLAGGISISSVWLFLFITSFAFPHMTEAMPVYIVYWILSAFSAIGVFVAFFVVPETKGKSLEAIELGSKGK